MGHTLPKTTIPVHQPTTSIAMILAKKNTNPCSIHQTQKIVLTVPIQQIAKVFFLLVNVYLEIQKRHVVVNLYQRIKQRVIHTAKVLVLVEEVPNVPMLSKHQKPLALL